MGQLDGSIIAIIIASHISRKIPTASMMDCPGILIHIMDISQPPGIRMPPDMVRAAFRVNAADARNSTPAKLRAHNSFLFEAGVTCTREAISRSFRRYKLGKFAVLAVGFGLAVGFFEAFGMCKLQKSLEYKNFWRAEKRKINPKM
jgi:hypothetical protein